jgi:hypothetical protein
MTCREFEHRGSSWTLAEVLQEQDQQMLSHAGECRKCAAWLQQQRMLAGTMQTLRARTADRSASPKVEQALLAEFRQRDFQPPQPEMAYGVTPIAMGLSRFFEMGAYVAVAAAILVGLFLGVRLLERRSANLPVESQSAAPAGKSPSPVANGSQVGPRQQTTVLRNGTGRSGRRHVQSVNKSSQDATGPQQTSTDADYIALMLCDPLSCSSDTQVVRMELPSAGVTGPGGEQDAQVRIADVIVGYDGVVRAVRIVN